MLTVLALAVFLRATMLSGEAAGADVSGIARVLEASGSWGLVAVCLVAVSLLYRDAARRAERIDRERLDLQEKLVGVIDKLGVVLVQVRDGMEQCHAAGMTRKREGDAPSRRGFGVSHITPAENELQAVRGLVEQSESARRPEPR